jgi:nicotinamidase-related amidase
VAEPTVAPRAVLLLVDFQVGVLDGLGGAPDLVARVRALADEARRVGLHIVHVRTAFRPGHPEVGAGNRLFSGLRAAQRLVDGAPDTAFSADLEPAEGETVVTKHRIDPFLGTELDMVLRAQGADPVVVAGIVTSGAVLSTVRAAADRDYRVVLVADSCTDRDPEVHALLTQRVLPMTAQVVDRAGWQAALSPSG